MNNTQSTPTMLMFGDKPIRVVTFEDGGTIHFSLQDICEAMGWSVPTAVSKIDSLMFPAHGKRIAEEVSDEGVRNVTVLTPVGVFYLTDLMDAAKGQRLSAWAKREARRLFPDAPESDPTMFLTLSPGKRRPPRPMKYSGWSGEWHALWTATLNECRGAHNPAIEFQELRYRAADRARMDFLDARRAEGGAE